MTACEQLDTDKDKCQGGQKHSLLSAFPDGDSDPLLTAGDVGLVHCFNHKMVHANASMIWLT